MRSPPTRATLRKVGSAEPSSERYSRVHRLAAESRPARSPGTRFPNRNSCRRRSDPPRRPVILFDGVVVLLQADQGGDIKLARFLVVRLELHGFGEQSKRFLIPALLKADFSQHKIWHEQFRSELQSVCQRFLRARELIL